MAIWGLIAFGFFWGIAILATYLDGKGPPWYVSGAIWLAILLPMLLWAYRDVRRDLAKSIERLERALRGHSSIVFHIQSERVVEFEEEEDEGACYACQLSDGRIVFVVGQQFYASPKFPNDDFDVVEIGPGPDVTLELIETHGRKVEPERVISARRKSQLRIPAHLETIAGRLDKIEELLA